MTSRCLFNITMVKILYATENAQKLKNILFVHTCMHLKSYIIFIILLFLSYTKITTNVCTQLLFSCNFGCSCCSAAPAEIRHIIKYSHRFCTSLPVCKEVNMNKAEKVALFFLNYVTLDTFLNIYCSNIFATETFVVSNRKNLIIKIK